MTAELREVPEHPNYMVSSDGKVWSRPREGTRGGWLEQGLSSGYRRVALHRDGKQITARVHSLVALAFLGPRPDGQEVRHLNGNALDNRLANLKYGTKAENSSDTLAHGMHYQANKTHCKRNHEYTPENTFNWADRPRRECKACRRELSRQRYAAKKLLA